MITPIALVLVSLVAFAYLFGAAVRLAREWIEEQERRDRDGE